MRRVILDLLATLRARIEVDDIDEPHVVLETDPETGHQQVIGPYPNAYSALGATVQMTAQHAINVGDPPATYKVVMYFRPDQYGLTDAVETGPDPDRPSQH